MITTGENRLRLLQQPRPRGGTLQTLLETIVDRLPKSKRLAQGEYGATIRKAIERLLPNVLGDEREAIVRGAVRHKLAERAIFHFHMTLPSVAALIARFVPLRASLEIEALFKSDEPVVIGSAHFGPLFFELLVLRRLLRDRHMVVVLRQRAFYLRKAIPFLQRFGVEIVFDTSLALRALARTLKTRPRAAVLFMFDHTHEGRRVVQFLAGHIRTCNGAGLIADVGDARVVAATWRWDGLAPHVDLSGPYATDRTLPLVARRERLLDRLNGLLQSLIQTTPEQWSGWDSVGLKIVDRLPAPASFERRHRDVASAEQTTRALRATATPRTEAAANDSRAQSDVEVIAGVGKVASLSLVGRRDGEGLLQSSR